jgi:hypothetical protein
MCQGRISVRHCARRTEPHGGTEPSSTNAELRVHGESETPLIFLRTAYSLGSPPIYFIAYDKTSKRLRVNRPDASFRHLAGIKPAAMRICNTPQTENSGIMFFDYASK